MTTSGIVLNVWKLPIFREHLDRGGFEYVEREGPTPDSTVILVETTDLTALKKFVLAATADAEIGECRTLH